MDAVEGPRPLVAVSLKMYFSAAATRRFVAGLADMAGRADFDGVEPAVLPTFPLLESTARELEGTGVHWGAQDVAITAAGAQTGEVSADVLAELGCRYVEVGHAERRRLFGEDRRTLDGKLAQAVAAGLTPVYCVGETERPADPERAATECLADLDAALQATRGHPLVVAYEPVWAIGADAPAPADHVGPVCRALRDRALDGHPDSRVIYGGAAGPGTYTDLDGSVDGLFLGRFAHDLDALAGIVHEVAAATRTPTAHRSTHPFG